MSDVFELDTAGAEALEDEARRNPFDPNAPMPLSTWSGTGQQFKQLLRGPASSGRTVMMAGAPLFVGADAVRNKAREVGDAFASLPRSPFGSSSSGEVKQRGESHEFGDWYFKTVVEGIGQNAVDHWTPDAASSGTAANTLGTIFNVAGKLPEILGAAPLFLADAAIAPGMEVVQHGGSTEAALGTAGVSLGVNALGMRLPAAFGSNLPTRIATGAGSNVALGMGQNAATQEILERDGLDELAEAYDPLNAQALTLDTLMGAAFGWRANVEAKHSRLTPSERAAVLAANNAHQFANANLPGKPKTPAAAVQHQTALTAAAEQLLRGEPVRVEIDLEGFILRPELRPDSAIDVAGYDEFRIALESGGRADADAPTSDAFGLDQFIPDTWRKIVAKAAPAWAEGLTDAELLAARGDPAKSAAMERVLRAENAAMLERAGAPVSTINLYATHHFGPRGVKFAKADGDTPIAEILTAGQIKANGYLEGKTKDQAIAIWRARARKAGAMVADNPDAPNFDLPEAPRTVDDADPIWQAIPEGKDGRETLNIDTPERQAFREQLVAEHFNDAQARILGPGERPVAYVMGGGGASGKGTLLKLLKAQGEIPRDLVEIDPDAIKTGDDARGLSGIPEYRQLLERGDSRAAAVVHEESSQVAAAVKLRAIAEGRDFVLDRTLGDPGKAEAELAKLAETHEIRLFGVTLDPGEAVERAVKRAKGSGRFVPLNHLLRAHKGFAAGFPRYASIADQVRLYDNTTAPELLAQGGKGELEIFERNGYNRFVERSSLDDQATTHRQLAHARRASGGQAEADRSEGLGTSAPGAGERGERARSPERPQELDPAEFPAQGSDTTVVTERGLRLAVRYAVVDAADLVTSHDDALNVNPAFPAELQPRDRARAASEQQIARIAGNINPELLAESPKAADGAPIVGRDKVVESGNARTIALRRAYASGKGEAYRKFLVDEAERFGLDPAALDGLEEPVLVRVALEEYDRADFARQANESTVAAMSATEQALADARALPDMADLQTLDDGTINMRASARFVSGFIQTVGPNERAGMATADGDLSQQGQARIRNAVFARAYGDAELVAMMAEATDANVKNVLAGMLRAAPAIARLREMIAEGGRVGPDITPDLVSAVRKFSQLRRDGVTVEQFEAQGDFFGEGGLTPRARDLLRTVGENARAPKRMAEFLQRYVDAVEVLGDPRQADLMGGQGEGADGAVKRASEATRAAHDTPAPRAGSLFNAAGRPTTEAAPAPVTFGARDTTPVADAKAPAGITVSEKPSTSAVGADGEIWLEAKSDKGFVGGHITGDHLKISASEVGEAHRGQGHGTELYAALLDEAFRRGLRVESDATVSAEAVRVYQALERRGYQVQRAPGSGDLEGGGVHGPETGKRGIESIGGAFRVAPKITPENRAAYEAIAAMPNLEIMGEDGVMRPAGEFLAEGDAEAAQAAETVRAVEAAANCFLRNAA